jgi:TPR repeat protein
MLLSLLLSMFILDSGLAQLTPGEQNSRKLGILLYQQSAWDSAQPFLKVAADAGDLKAQYYLGEAIRLNNMYMTSEARKWYQAAAEQGDLYAMLRLSSGGDLCRIIGTCDGKSGKQWREHALNAARERAKVGDTEAMTVLYTLGEGLSWLEKAAIEGDSDAQHFLALAYKNGDGWFLVPGSRDKTVEQWAKASAEGGFVPGMYFYADLLHKKNSPKEEVGYWLKKTAEAGHIETLAGYALMSRTCQIVTGSH